MTVPWRYLFSSASSKASSRCRVELAAASLTFATRLSLTASRWIARSTSEKVYPASPWHGHCIKWFTKDAMLSGLSNHVSEKPRSEERRVGEECRCGSWREH